MAKNILIFGEHISWYRIVGMVVIGAIAVLTASTVGEFAVSAHNRYSVYPAGTDTNMYGNSAIGQGLTCLLAAGAIAYLLRKRIDVGAVALAFVLCLLLVGFSSQVSSFIPEDWCKYELTMYRCADQLNPAMNIKQ